MITKTAYQCEICGEIHWDKDIAIHCENRCRIIKELEEIFGNDEWCPPPIKDFHKWSDGDKNEMACKILHLLRYSRQRESEQYVFEYSK